MRVAGHCRLVVSLVVPPHSPPRAPPSAVQQSEGGEGLQVSESGLTIGELFDFHCLFLPLPFHCPSTFLSLPFRCLSSHLAPPKYRRESKNAERAGSTPPSHCVSTAFLLEDTAFALPFHCLSYSAFVTAFRFCEYLLHHVQ